MKKQSALEQVMSLIQGGYDHLPPEQKGALDKFQQVVHGLFGQKTEPEVAQPVAYLSGGNILFSDGSVQVSPDQKKLNTLRQNVLDQNYFTPQAKKYLESIPVHYGTTEAEAAGQYDPQTKSINIRQNIMKYHTLPTEVLLHEMLHAMDANVNNNYNASMKPINQNSGDSYGIYPQIEDHETSQDSGKINSFLKNYSNDPRTYDTESFAQYAAPKGSRVLLDKVGPRYSNIFVPASKSINYTPVYETQEAVRNKFGGGN